KGIDMTGVRERTDRHVKELAHQAEVLSRKAKEEQTIGDRHYWPIYNLDIKNPSAPEEEVHDPDKLLARYQKVLADISATETRLKNELSAALSHHFERETV